jgi:hypothetical protein
VVLDFDQDRQTGPKDKDMFFFLLQAMRRCLFRKRLRSLRRPDIHRDSSR